MPDKDETLGWGCNALNEKTAQQTENFPGFQIKSRLLKPIGESPHFRSVHYSDNILLAAQSNVKGNSAVILYFYPDAVKIRHNSRPYNCNATKTVPYGF